MEQEIIINPKKNSTKETSFFSKRQLYSITIFIFALDAILHLIALRVFIPSILGISYFNIDRFPKIFGINSNLSFFITITLVYALLLFMEYIRVNLTVDAIEISSAITRQTDMGLRITDFQKPKLLQNTKTNMIISLLLFEASLILKIITPLSNNSFVDLVKNANSFVSYISAFSLLAGMVVVLIIPLYNLICYPGFLYNEIKISLQDHKMIIDFFEKDLDSTHHAMGTNAQNMIKDLIMHPFSSIEYLEAKGMFNEIEECKS